MTLVDRPVIECDGSDEVAVKLWPVLVVWDDADEMTLVDKPVLECDGPDEVAVILWPVLLEWPVLVSDGTDEVTLAERECDGPEEVALAL